MPSMLAENILTENLLSLNAVSFLTEEPLRLRSGLVTPIYIDNRMLIAHPDAWHDVIETMASLIEKWGLEYDVIAGVEAGGLTHSAALAYRLFRPTIYVRQNAKTYGNLHRIEGGSVKGKRVLIIEDHISTGLSCLDAIKTLREQGAIVTDCVSITNFDMAETATLFEEAGVKMHRMISFNKVVDKAVEMGHITEEQKKTIHEWLKAPWTWAARQGLVASTREN